MKGIIALLCLFFLSATAEVYFQEEFGAGWENRWVVSTFKGDEAGKIGVSAGKHFNDAEADKGLQTQQDLKFYQVSAAFPEFSNKGKTLVLQYSVKHEQNIDCGGGYVKILPAGLDQSNFNGDSEYNIMFGPDVCGSTKKVHLILTYKGKNYLLKKDVRAETDTFSHVYTAILNPDQTYKILIDNKEVRSGSLLEDWDFLPPKEIKDPAVSKPADWVDEKEIPDPEAKKPEGWDDIPAQIADPDAQKPDDWDDELDGEWTAPTIANPEYKGEWKAPKIPNPEYKGEWVHPLIPNPDYKEDAEIYAFNSNKYLGIEIWQVKSGTIFDNFLITDDVELASEWAKKTEVAREAEKKAHEEAEKARKAELEKQGIDESDDEIDIEALEGLGGEEDVHDEL